MWQAAFSEEWWQIKGSVSIFVAGRLYSPVVGAKSDLMKEMHGIGPGAASVASAVAAVSVDSLSVIRMAEEEGWLMSTDESSPRAV